MKTETEYKLMICLECNLYKDTCDGKKFFERTKTVKACRNREKTEINTVNPIQVLGFMAFFDVKKKAGENNLVAFAEAMAQTSDDVFKQYKNQNAYLIERFKKKLSKHITKATQIISKRNRQANA